MPHAKEWLTKEEVDRIFASPDLSLKHRALILLMYACALRVSEALNLTPADIDFDKRELVIWKSKTDKQSPHAIPVPDAVLQGLKQYIHSETVGSGEFLFKGYARKPMTTMGVWKAVRVVARAVNIHKDIGTHTFRRSRATHLLNDGVAIQDVSRLLRHKTLNTTMDYLKISVDDLRQRIEAKDSWKDKEAGKTPPVAPV